MEAERPPVAAARHRAPGDHGRAGARVSEFAGTIWRWAAVAALLAVAAIALIALRLDDDDLPPGPCATGAPSVECRGQQRTQTAGAPPTAPR